METFLLLALGAWVVSRMQTPTTATPPPQEGQNGTGVVGTPPGQGSGLPVEVSRIRLPHIVVGGKEVVALTLPVPAAAVYKWVECKEPGGAMRVADIQSKWLDYQTAYNTWVSEGRPTSARKGTKKGKVIKAVQDAKNAYQKAVSFHFTSCTNYAKQL